MMSNSLIVIIIFSISDPEMHLFNYKWVRELRKAEVRIARERCRGEARMALLFLTLRLFELQKDRFIMARQQKSWAEHALRAFLHMSKYCFFLQLIFHFNLRKECFFNFYIFVISEWRGVPELGRCPCCPGQRWFYRYAEHELSATICAFCGEDLWKEIIADPPQWLPLTLRGRRPSGEFLELIGAMERDERRRLALYRDE